MRRLFASALLAAMLAAPALAQGAPPPPDVEAGKDLMAIAT